MYQNEDLFNFRLNHEILAYYLEQLKQLDFEHETHKNLIKKFDIVCSQPIGNKIVYVDGTIDNRNFSYNEKLALMIYSYNTITREPFLGLAYYCKPLIFEVALQFAKNGYMLDISLSGNNYCTIRLGEKKKGYIRYRYSSKSDNPDLIAIFPKVEIIKGSVY